MMKYCDLCGVELEQGFYRVLNPLPLQGERTMNNFCHYCQYTHAYDIDERTKALSLMFHELEKRLRRKDNDNR